jgi:hypothetical protein
MLRLYILLLLEISCKFSCMTLALMNLIYQCSHAFIDTKTSCEQFHKNNHVWVVGRCDILVCVDFSIYASIMKLFGVELEWFLNNIYIPTKDKYIPHSNSYSC